MLVALMLLAGPWAQAQDARTGRHTTPAARLQAAPAEPQKGDNPVLDALSTSWQTGPVDVFRTGGPDAGGYSFTDSTEPGGPTYNFIDISSTGTALTLANYTGCTAGDAGDEGRASLTLPFSFPFYGTNRTTAFVYANGLIGFDTAFAACTFTNAAAIPSTTAPNQFIAPWWDDLDDAAGSSVKWQVVGGNLIIQWTNVVRFQETATNTFQAILYPNGNIRFQYGPLNTATQNSQTVGIEGSGATGQGLLVNANAAGYIANGLAVQINSTPPPPPVPAAYASSGITEAFEFVNYPDSTSLWFVGVYQVVVGGNTGTVNITNATLDVIGSMNPAGILEARLFSTGTSTAAPTTSTPTLGPALSNPSDPLSFTGSIALSPGTNYFWLVAALDADAVPGTNYSAAFTSVTVGGTAYTPSPAHDGNFNTIGFPPTNDDLVEARPVYETAFSDFASNGGGSVEAGEANATCAFSGFDGTNSIWWKYTPSTSGTATFGAEGFDTILAVYTGTSFPLTEVGCADDLAATGVEEVEVAVTGGTTYYVRITGYDGASGEANLTVAGPAPALPYTVTEPTASAVTEAGKKVVVRWTGAGVPMSTQFVNVYGRQGDSEMVLLKRVPNTGKAKVFVPAGTATGSDYEFIVSNESIPSAVGVSAESVVFSEAEQYTFTEPDAGDFLARGLTHTVTYEAPENAPTGGTVTLRLYRDSGALVATAAAETDDGSIDVAIPSNQAVGLYYFTISNDTDGAFFGQSGTFTISRFEVTTPTEGTTWSAGSSQEVAWTAGAPTAGATVKISLRGVSVTFNQSLANNVAYGNFTRVVTVPAAAPAGTYRVQLLYTLGATTFTVNSDEFTITNPLAPAPTAPTHFAAPVAGSDARETTLVVRGLAEGAEVGVFAGEYLLATAAVVSGEALVAVPSEIALGANEFYFGETAALTLRVFEAGTESMLEATRVVRGSDEATVSGVTMAAGDVLVVEAAKGGATAGTATAVFMVQGVSPNPAASSATVRFTSPASAAATVVVYDLLGRAVSTAFSGEAQEGLNEVSLATGELPAGVYVVRVTAGAESATTRFTVVR